MVRRKKPLTSAKDQRQFLRDNITAIKALEKIDESIRNSTSTIAQLFHEIDANCDGFLEKNEFFNGITKITNITLTPVQVQALIELVDYTGDGVVQLDEFEWYIKQIRKLRREHGSDYAKKMLSDQDNDHVFPNWLTARSDFCALFTRFSRDEMNDNADEEQMERLFIERKPKLTRENMHRVGRWLQLRNILNGLSFQRYVDLSQKLHFMVADSGQVLCQQGEIGNAFFIIFSGAVDIIVDSVKVHTLSAGGSFGERSLETNEPRNATCKCSCPSRILCVKAHDYKMMMKQHQAKKLKYAVSFLQNDCTIVRDWPYSKISTLSTMLVRRMFSIGDFLFQQGDDPFALYLLLSGKVVAQRATNIDEYQNNRRSRFDLKYFVAGDLIGEDFILGFEKRQYSAIAVTDIDCFVINRNDALNYFFGDEEKIQNSACDLYVPVYELEKRRRKRQAFEEIKMCSFGKKYLQRLSGASKGCVHYSMSYLSQPKYVNMHSLQTRFPRT